MIGDRFEYLSQYPQLTKISVLITEYLQSVDIEEFNIGKFRIINGLYAIHTEYDTIRKRESVSETHDNFYDLVIILSGEEKIYIDSRNECKQKRAYDAENDITLYQGKCERITVKLRSGYFVLFGPNDVHRPYCHLKSKSHIKKITFKIAKALII